jgi:hypothetical protein
MKSKLLFCRLSGFFFLAILVGIACGKKVTIKDQDSYDNVGPSVMPSRTSNLIAIFMAGDACEDEASIKYYLTRAIPLSTSRP